MAIVFDWAEDGFSFVFQNDDGGRIDRRIENRRGAKSGPPGWYYVWRTYRSTHECQRGPYRSVAELIQQNEMEGPLFSECLWQARK